MKNPELEDEERIDIDFFHTFKLEARDLAIITFDLRHLSRKMRYGRDWRIRVFASEGEVDPLHEDSLDCEYLLSDEAKPPG